MSYTIVKRVPTHLNRFTGRLEPVEVPQRADWKPFVVFGSRAILGLRKRRTTPGAPFPFSYGWERVYRKVDAAA